MESTQPIAWTICFTFAEGGGASSKEKTTRSALMLYGISAEDANELQVALGVAADHAEVLALLERRGLLKDPLRVQTRACLLHTTYKVLANLSGSSSTAKVQDVLTVMRDTTRLPPEVVKEVTLTWSSLVELDLYQFLLGLSRAKVQDHFSIEGLYALLDNSRKVTSQRGAGHSVFEREALSQWLALSCCGEEDSSESELLPAQTASMLGGLPSAERRGPQATRGPRRFPRLKDPGLDLDAEEPCFEAVASTKPPVQESKAFTACWTLLKPDGGGTLSFEEALALLVLLGANPSRALFLLAHLSSCDPLGPLRVESLLNLFDRLGLKDGEEGATAHAEVLKKTYEGLNPGGAALPAREFAQLLSVRDSDFAADFYSCCKEKGFSSVSLSNFVVLMLQPQLVRYIRADGLERREQDTAVSRDLRPLRYLQRLLLRLVPSYDGFRPSSQGQDSQHWHRTDLVFDAHCLEPVGRWNCLKAKLMIYFVTFLSGIDSMLFALASVWCAAFAEKQLGSDSSYGYYALSTFYSLVLTGLEISMMTLLTTIGAGLLARATGVTFSQFHKQRRAILSSFLRSALDLGFRSGRRLGVDPFKRASVSRAFVLTIVVKLQRTVISFVVMLVVKKTLPRLLAKSAVGNIDAYLDYAIKVGVCVLFGITGSWVAMHNATFCSLGPPAAVHVMCKLFDRRDAAVAEASGFVQPLSDGAKLAALRAVAVTMARERALFIHPNAVYLLQFLQDLWVSEEFLKRTIPLLPEPAFVSEVPVQYNSRSPTGKLKDQMQEGCLARVRRLMGAEMKEPSPQRDGNVGLAPFRLDEEELFFKCLVDLRMEDFILVVALLSLGCIVDGSLDTHDWPLVVTAVHQREVFPAPSLVALGRARRHLWMWYDIAPETLYAVFDGTAKGCLVPWQPEFRAVLWLKLFPSRAAPLLFDKDRPALQSL